MFQSHSRRFLSPALLPFLVCSMACSAAVLQAQTPTPPAPVPADSVPSMPAPVTGNPAGLPSVPAAGQSPAAVPGQTQTPDAASPPPFHDPLEQPIVVAPASTPAPGAAPSPVQVAMPTPTTVGSVSSLPAFDVVAEVPERIDALGSTYIPVDSPIYPMALRLYSLGYLDRLNISMRPWTRRSLLHAMDQSAPDITADNNDEAVAILARLQSILQAEVAPRGFGRGRVEGLESAYTRIMGIGGTTLRDSYHLGQTLNNDYGRPYQPGFNNITGFSSVNEWGRFSLYVRGEYQHAPGAAGYNAALAGYLSGVDLIPFPGDNNNQLHQDTLPYGPLPASNPFRLQEVTLSYHLLGHEISFGKSDAWLGPDYGGSMAWSNNAEDIYGFRINRVEPMYIPYLDKIIGPIRYDYMIGPLQGHSYPNGPWVHQVMFAIQPYKDFTFSIQSTGIWGGHGHGCYGPQGLYPCTEPITLHTYLKSQFSIGDVDGSEKYSTDDPGARFSSATFAWRLPFLRRDVTLYTDSITHDDDLPLSAPRRAGWRPGIYFSHVPRVPKLDFRLEGDYTDYVTLRSTNGNGSYYETIQRQGYTNKGFIFGDWIGREGKGGQAWLTYHLSPDDFIQVEYLTKKQAKDFIVYGTTQNQVKVEFVKHFRHDLEADAWLQYERWKAPIYLTGGQNDVVGAVQLTWWPRLRTMHVPGGK